MNRSQTLTLLFGTLLFALALGLGIGLGHFSEYTRPKEIEPKRIQRGQKDVFEGEVDYEFEVRHPVAPIHYLLTNRGVFSLMLALLSWLSTFLIDLLITSNGGDLQNVAGERIFLHEAFHDPFITFKHAMRWIRSMGLGGTEREHDEFRIVGRRTPIFLIALLLALIDGGTDFGMAFGALGNQKPIYEALKIAQVQAELDDFSLLGTIRNGSYFSTSPCQRINLVGCGIAPKVVASYLACTTIISDRNLIDGNNSFIAGQKPGIYSHERAGVGPKGSVVVISERDGVKSAAYITVKANAKGNSETRTVAFTKISEQLGAKDDFRLSKCIGVDDLNEEEKMLLGDRPLGNCDYEFLKYVGAEVSRSIRLVFRTAKDVMTEDKILRNEVKYPPSNEYNERALLASITFWFTMASAALLLASISFDLLKREVVILNNVLVANLSPFACSRHTLALAGRKYGLRKRYAKPELILQAWCRLRGDANKQQTLSDMVRELKAMSDATYCRVMRKIAEGVGYRDGNGLDSIEFGEFSRMFNRATEFQTNHGVLEEINRPGQAWNATSDRKTWQFWRARGRVPEIDIDTHVDVIQTVPPLIGAEFEPDLADTRGTRLGSSLHCDEEWSGDIEQGFGQYEND